MTTCQGCGQVEVPCGTKYCEECRKVNVNLFYAYKELRWELWTYLTNHGVTRAKELYSNMVDEEGEQWVREVLGNKLVDAILIGSELK